MQHDARAGVECRGQLAEAGVERQRQRGEQRVVGSLSRYDATLFAPATMLRCDSTTPFGLPVLPDV